MNRNAVFFSLAALLIVGAFFVATSQTVRTQTTADRIVQLRDITQDVRTLDENILPGIIRAHSYDTLSVLAAHAPYPSVESVKGEFSQCFQGCSLMVGRSMEERLEAVVDAYEDDKQYSDVSFEVLHVELLELGPFALGVTAEVHTKMRDEVNDVRIDRTDTVTVRVPVVGLPDPYFEDRFGQSRSVKTPPAGLADDLSEDGTTVTTNALTNRTLEHAIHGYYRPDEDGPSYLGRLTADPSGGGNFGLHSIAFQPAEENSVDYQQGDDDHCFYTVKLSGVDATNMVNLPPGLAGNPYRLINVEQGLVSLTGNCP